MAKSLEKIRKEHASRPLIGISPSDVEAMMPQKPEVITHSDCTVEGCELPGFRHQPRCKKHHLRWIADQKLERDARHEASLKFQNSKKGQEERAIHDTKVSRYNCDDCGQFLKYSERLVKPKVFKKKKKQPILARDRYEVLCADCI